MAIQDDSARQKGGQHRLLSRTVATVPTAIARAQARTRARRTPAAIRSVATVCNSRGSGGNISRSVVPLAGSLK